jgi:hypothetical protein
MGVSCAVTDKPLENSSAGRLNHATVFIWIFAVSSIWHYASSSTEISRYWLHYDALVTPLIFLSIVTAFIAAAFPTRTWALLTFSFGQLTAVGLRFPYVADHLVMELFLNLSIVAAFCYLAISNRTLRIGTAEIFELFSPVGRWLLMLMYFFGTFHKFNPGFMSLESSCAVPFVTGFPLPDSLLAREWVQWAAIYGTLIIELAAMMLLMSARTKYVGMLLGMSFHFVIGISTYGTMAHFSAFAMALHTLFLPSTFGSRIAGESFIPGFLKNADSFKLLTISLIALQIAFGLHLGFTRQGYLVNALYALFGLTLLYLVFRHGQMRSDDAPYRLRSRLLVLNIIPVWFFLHCMSPYIGLGTGGTTAMFSGLRTEGGISNHYIIRQPLRLFPYQDDVVYIDEAQNSSLVAAMKDGQGIVLFDFQRHFMKREQLILPLRLRVNEVSYELNDLESFERFANERFTKQSWLEQKYMSFRLVDQPHPNRCRH